MIHKILNDNIKIKKMPPCFIKIRSCFIASILNHSSIIFINAQAFFHFYLYSTEP